ncbi:MAG: class I SAM-dependent methyltransferase [Chromatiales bacterium]|nr:class I SAM-dependent methyltransferase [Chromatiales bacterium]
MSQWCTTPLGQAVLEREEAVMRGAISRLFGYHLLQIGEGRRGFLEASRISHRMVMVDECDCGLRDVEGVEYLRGDSANLPIASDSIDVVVLPHRLEYESDPHQLLREVDRVLIPEGHLLISCFNPLSQFGLRRLLQGWRGDAPWSGHFFTPMRIKDWLSLLGFDTVQLQYYFYRPPVQHQAAMLRLERMEGWGGRFCSPLGGAYVLLAKKRVSTLTPIRTGWRNSRKLVTIGVTGTSAGRGKHEQ